MRGKKLHWQCHTWTFHFPWLEVYTTLFSCLGLSWSPSPTLISTYGTVLDDDDDDDDVIVVASFCWFQILLEAAARSNSSLLGEIIGALWANVTAASSSSRSSRSNPSSSTPDFIFDEMISFSFCSSRAFVCCWIMSASLTNNGLIAEWHPAMISVKHPVRRIGSSAERT